MFALRVTTDMPVVLADHLLIRSTPNPQAFGIHAQDRPVAAEHGEAFGHRIEYGVTTVTLDTQLFFRALSLGHVDAMQQNAVDLTAGIA